MESSSRVIIKSLVKPSLEWTSPQYNVEYRKAHLYCLLYNLSWKTWSELYHSHVLASNKHWRKLLIGFCVYSWQSWGILSQHVQSPVRGIPTVFSIENTNSVSVNIQINFCRKCVMKSTGFFQLAKPKSVHAPHLKETYFSGCKF